MVDAGGPFRFTELKDTVLLPGVHPFDTVSLRHDAGYTRNSARSAHCLIVLGIVCGGGDKTSS